MLVLIMEVDRNDLEILDRSQCLRLLSSAWLGRVAITVGALPSVLPVTFQLHRERILVRTRRSSRLDNALRNSVVAFEADDVDLSAHTGWSVAATGLATELRDSELNDARLEQFERWTPSPDDATLIAISTEVLTGRRIVSGSQRTRR